MAFYTAYRGQKPLTIEQSVPDSVRAIVETGFGVELWTSDVNYAPFPPGMVDEICDICQDVTPLTVHTSSLEWHPEAIKTELKTSAKFGASLFIVHPNTLGFEKRDFPPEKSELLDLFGFAADLGITPALENSGRTGMKMMRRAFDYVGFDSGLRVCIDTGHAHRAALWEKIPGDEYLREFRDLIVELHINDNEGTDDLHLPPGEGTIEWTAIYAEMRKLREDVVLCLEITSLGDPVEALAKASNRILRGLNLAG